MKKLSIEISRTTANKIDVILKNSSASSIDSLIAILIDKAVNDLKQKRRLL